MWTERMPRTGPGNTGAAGSRSSAKLDVTVSGAVAVQALQAASARPAGPPGK